MHSTARRRRNESWTRMNPKTFSSAIPMMTSIGPNGSPGNWRMQATTPYCKPGTFLRVATSSSTWMPLLSSPHAPLPYSPRTISRPNSQPPNGRQRSDVIPQESRDCSYPYGYEQSLLSCGITSERCRPFGGCEFGREIVRGEYGNGACGELSSGIHVEDEVATRKKVPGLQYGGVACILQLPGDPFGPMLVIMGIADEKVFGFIRVHDSFLLRLAVECIFGGSFVV